MTLLRRRLSCALGITTAGALALAPTAGAKISFDGAARSYDWGERVSLTIAGCVGNRVCEDAVDDQEVFLVRGRSRPGTSRSTVRSVGRIQRGGRLVFRMPAVHAGSHRLAMRMRTDAGPRWVTVTSMFRVGGMAAAPLDCGARSSAGFPRAFTSRDNLVVGPVALVGAAYKSLDAVRRFGGDKLPVLVKAGHRVTVAVPADQRRRASLSFGRRGGTLTQRRVSDGLPAATFVACEREAVTFWMGFVLLEARRGCVPLDVVVDRERTPRRVVLRLGVDRCP